MKIKTSELQGKALDYCVAVCEGWRWRKCDGKYPVDNYSPSVNWLQGGPIIERDCICTYASGACSVAPKNPDYWVAEILCTEEMLTHYGDTPLIALLRCYVASKLGDWVDVPDEY